MFTVLSRPVFMLLNAIKPRAFSKSPKYHPTHSGFTLLEFLVVITLLGIIAGAVVLGYEDVQDQGREDMTRFEMTEIRKALLQFRRDSGSNDFPTVGIYDCTDSENGNPTNVNPDMTFPAAAGNNNAERITWCQSVANFWMLFQDPLGNGWNPDTRRGWNGPYLRNRSIVNTLWIIADAYNNPYQLQDLANADEARIVSTGGDGVYGGENVGDACLANDGDDRILCLLR